MITRKVKFYNLVLEKSNNLNLFESEHVTIQDKVAQLESSHYDSDKFQIIENKVFMLLSFDRNHIFGTFGKMDDVGAGDHIRGRNKNNYSVEDIHNFIESYTYFYLDLDSKILALLNNSSLPDIKKPFSHFIGSHFRITGVYDTIDLVPVISSEIPSRYGDDIPVVSAKISYADDRFPINPFINATEMLGIASADIKKADINISMKQGAKAKKKFFNFNRSDYSELKLETEEESIDLLDNVITKKVTIEIDSDDIKNDEVIKEKLRTILAYEF